MSSRRVARHAKLARDGRRAKSGGSAWESNPASPRKRGATDFEDREGHRAPFTSEKNCIPDGRVGVIAECGLRVAELLRNADRGLRTYSGNADCGCRIMRRGIRNQSELRNQSALRSRNPQSIRNPQSAIRSALLAFDQPNVARARPLL